MVKIDPTIYVSSSVQDNEVIALGKSPTLEQKDIDDGVSRFGGFWRKPSYTKAYLRAVRSLINTAIETKDLDQLGLPIFYLHRHTLELLMKNLLDILYDIARLRHDLNPTDRSEENLPTKGQLGRLTSEHNLSNLSNDLKLMSIRLGFDDLPDSIERLVKLIDKYETEPTWSRYPRSNRSNSKVYLSSEVVIPSLEIHDALEMVIRKIEYDVDSEQETFETTLHREWIGLTTCLENG